MAAASLANKYSAFNAILLSFFAVAIPGVFGSAATYLIGRETMRAGTAALLAEGLIFVRSLGKLAGNLANKGIKSLPALGTATGSGVRKGINYLQDRQFTKDFYKFSTMGDFAKAARMRLVNNFVSHNKISC
jgi:hypothetical protein